MKCAACGIENEEQSGECRQCGQSLNHTPTYLERTASEGEPEPLLKPGENFGSRYLIGEQIGAGNASDKEIVRSLKDRKDFQERRCRPC